MQTRTVIISDTKRGHENQSRVLARMLGDPDPLVMNLRPSMRNGGLAELSLRIRMALLGNGAFDRKMAARIVERQLRPETKWAFRDFAMGVAASQGKSRLYTISTGTPPATFNLVMSIMLGSTSIINMTPSLLPRSCFDLNIVPAHDMPAGQVPPANVVITRLALGFHDGAAAQQMATKLAAEHQLTRGARYWGVAIGGPSKACPWVGDRVLDELAQLHGLARGEGARLLVTTSRRTPPHCLAWLKKHYLGSQQLAYFLDASQDPLNPLPAFYELSERMFITADSYSMLCEAVHAGHVPVVLKVRIGTAPGKLGRSLNELADAGLASLDTTDADLPARVPPVPPRHEANTHYEELREAVRYKLELGEGNEG